MFKASHQPVDFYKEVSVDAQVHGADPHRLIEMLFERAHEQLVAAEAAIVAGNTASKGALITHVIRIIDEGLRASLNHDAGELSANLSQLYDYMLRQLLQANQHNSVELVVEVRGLLSQLHSAWTEIGAKGASPATAAGSADGN